MTCRTSQHSWGLLFRPAVEAGSKEQDPAYDEAL